MTVARMENDAEVRSMGLTFPSEGEEVPAVLFRWTSTRGSKREL